MTPLKVTPAEAKKYQRNLEGKKGKAKMKTNREEPAVVFHPGEHLKDELDARGLSDVEFSQMTGIPIGKLKAILDEKSPILAWMAERIGASLGTSAMLWANLSLAFYKQHRKSSTDV